MRPATSRVAPAQQSQPQRAAPSRVLAAAAVMGRAAATAVAYSTLYARTLPTLFDSRLLPSTFAKRCTVFCLNATAAVLALHIPARGSRLAPKWFQPNHGPHVLRVLFGPSKHAQSHGSPRITQRCGSLWDAPDSRCQAVRHTWHRNLPLPQCGVMIHQVWCGFPANTGPRRGCNCPLAHVRHSATTPPRVLCKRRHRGAPAPAARCPTARPPGPAGGLGRDAVQSAIDARVRNEAARRPPYTHGPDIGRGWSCWPPCGPKESVGCRLAGPRVCGAHGRLRAEWAVCSLVPTMKGAGWAARPRTRVPASEDGQAVRGGVRGPGSPLPPSAALAGASRPQKRLCPWGPDWLGSLGAP